MFKKHLKTTCMGSLVAAGIVLAGITPALAEGTVKIMPRVSASVAYDDNIYSEQSNTDDDVITTVRPSLAIKAVSGELTTIFDSYVEGKWFADSSDDNVINFGLNGVAKYALAPNALLKAKAGYKFGHESRGDDDVNPANIMADPAEFEIFSGGVGIEGEEGPFNYDLTADLRKRDHDDVSRVGGGIVDNDLKDRLEQEYAARLGFDVTNQLEVYGSATHYVFNYDEDALNDRDSDGQEILAGVVFKPSDMLSVDVAAGYLGREFDNDATYADIGDMGYKVDVNFMPTADLTLGFDANRAIKETQDPGASSAVYDTFKLKAAYDVNEQWDVGGHGAFTNTKYQGGTSGAGGVRREDDYYEVKGAVGYKIVKDVRLELSHTYSERDTNVTNRDFDKNVTALGASVAF